MLFIKEIEFVIKSFSTKNTAKPIDFTGDLNKYFKGRNHTNITRKK